MVQASLPREIEALQAAAKHHQLRGETGAALQASGHAVELLRRAGDVEGLARQFCATARIHLQRGEPQEATEAGRAAEKIFKRLQDKHGEATVLLDVVVQVELQRNDTELALLAAKSAVDLFRAAGDVASLGAALEAAGRQYIARHEADEALRVLTEAAAIHKEAQDRGSEARVLDVLASARAMRGEADAAAQDALRALALCRETGDHAGEAAALQTLARVLLTMGASKEALSAASAAAGLFASFGAHHGEAAARRAAAEALLLETGELEQALQEASLSVSLYHNLGDGHSQASGTLLLAKVHFRKNNLETSLQTLREAVELHWVCDDVPGAADCLHAVVQLHLRRRAPRAALEAAEEAYVLAHKVGDRHTEATALQVLAWVHLQQASAGVGEAAAEAPSNGGSAYSWQLTAAARKDPTQAIPRSAVQAAGGAAAGFRGLRHKPGLARSLGLLARALLATGGSAHRALGAAEEAQGLYRELSQPRAEAASLLQAAVANFDAGACASARHAAEAAEALFQDAGDDRGEAAARNAVGIVSELDDARREELRPLEVGSCSDREILGRSFSWGLGQGALGDIGDPDCNRQSSGSSSSRATVMDKVKSALRRRPGAAGGTGQPGAFGREAIRIKDVPFQRKCFPWTLNQKEKMEQQEKSQQEKPQQPPSKAEAKAAAAPAARPPEEEPAEAQVEAPCDRCFAVTADGAWGLRAYEGLWFCRDCWRFWVDARLRVHKAALLRRRRQRQRPEGARGADAGDGDAGDSEWSNDEETEEMLESARLGKGATPSKGGGKGKGKKPGKGYGKPTGTGPVDEAGKGKRDKGSGKKGSPHWNVSEGSPRPGAAASSPPCATRRAPAAATPPPPPPKPAAAGAAGPRPDRAALEGKTLLQLYTQAKALALDNRVLGAAMDSDAPKAALIELMVGGR